MVIYFNIGFENFEFFFYQKDYRFEVNLIYRSSVYSDDDEAKF
jgi:hypothetical protein